MEEKLKDPIEGIDFSLWERLYGRELSYVEKLEIKTNLGDFFKALVKGDLNNRERKLKEYRNLVRSLLSSDEVSI